jgi:hypothetical protein
LDQSAGFFGLRPQREADHDKGQAKQQAHDRGAPVGLPVGGVKGWGHGNPLAGPGVQHENGSHDHHGPKNQRDQDGEITVDADRSVRKAAARNEPARRAKAPMGMTTTRPRVNTGSRNLLVT